MSLDGAFAGVAKALTKLGGRPATLLRPNLDGGYNPSTLRVEAPSAPDEYPCEAVFEEFTDAQIDGTTIKTGDRKAIVSRSRLGIEPRAQSDTLREEDSGKVWQIVRVMGFSSGRREAAYRLHVRS